MVGRGLFGFGAWQWTFGSLKFRRLPGRSGKSGCERSIGCSSYDTALVRLRVLPPQLDRRWPCITWQLLGVSDRWAGQVGGPVEKLFSKRGKWSECPPST